MAATDLLGLSRQRLAEILSPFLDRPFRVEQIHRAIHRRRVSDLAAITELGASLRGSLAARFRIGRPRLVAVESDEDGTDKLVLELADGETVETVDIPAGDRRTLCLSSQAGCALGCRFCVTGTVGGGRNLTAGEIVGQVFVAEERAPAARPSNLVLMGMGEPLLNLEAVRDALEILSTDRSWRRITVSTVGIIPGIRALSGWPRRPNLAISLHVPDDERRSRIIPTNRRYPVAELMHELRRYPLEGGRRLTIEILLLDGFNDSQEDALAVARLLTGLRAKINLIPMNPDPLLDPWLRPPPAARILAYRRRLERCGFSTTLRRRRGGDTAAACGQLRGTGARPAAE